MLKVFKGNACVAIIPVFTGIAIAMGFAAIMSGLAGVKIQKWWKFVIPVFLSLFVTQAILMIAAVLIGFGAY